MDERNEELRVDEQVVQFQPSVLEVRALEDDDQSGQVLQP